MKTNYKITKSTAIISGLCLFVIMTSPYLGQRVNNIIKLGFELILLLYLFSHKINFKAFANNIPIFIYFVVTNISTYLNHGASSRFLNSLITSMSYVLFFVFLSKYVYELGFQKVFSIVKINFIIYSIILDSVLLLTFGKGFGGEMGEPIFLLGNKFMVSYIHMFVLSTMFLNNKGSISTKKKRIIAFLYLIYSIVILRIADTTTGLMGLAIIAILLLVLEKGRKLSKIISNPSMVIILFLGSNVVLLLTDFIFENTFVYDFLLNRSHTSSLLSGRYQMYQIVMNAITKQPIWGYGINYEVVRETLSYGNAQNGLLKSLLDFGILGTASLLLVIYVSIKNVSEESEKFYCLAYIIGMVVCSLVEINLATMFFLVVALLNGAGMTKKERFNGKKVNKITFKYY